MQTKRETATLAARLLTFVMSLGILGCLWLPWVRIDGMRESSTGTELMVLMAAPSLDYLWVASPISAGVLSGARWRFCCSAYWWPLGMRSGGPLSSRQWWSWWWLSASRR